MKIRFADFELNDQNYQLRRSGREVRLRPKVFDLLVQLARNRERVVRREELVDALWGGMRVGAGSLSGLVNELRCALGEDGRGHSSIRTVHARGYQFVADVHEAGGQGTEGGTGSAAYPNLHDLIERVARRGSEGVILAGGAAGEAFRALEEAADESGFEIIRAEAPDEATGVAARFPRDLIRAMVAARGRPAVEKRLPLPARDWLVRDGSTRVAGGQAGSASSPPDAFLAAAQMLSGLALCRPVLLVVEGLPLAGVRFVQEFGRFVGRLGDAPVLCATCDPSEGPVAAWRRVLEQEAGFGCHVSGRVRRASVPEPSQAVLDELPPLLTDALVAHAKGDRQRVVRLLEHVQARTAGSTAMKTVASPKDCLRRIDEEAC